MKSICIKTNNSEFLEYLLNEFKLLELNNICFSSNEFKNFKNVIIHYNGNSEETFITEISSILALLVIDEFEEALLKDFIFDNYFYFNSEEQKKILSICYDISTDDFSVSFDKKYSYLVDSFYNYLLTHKSIVLSGFVNFRLPEYHKMLQNLVDEAVNVYVLEKEYLEFISLLKLYISTQSSEVDLVHLIFFEDNCVILDENKEIIPVCDDLLKTKYLSDISFSTNDYILNTLLNLLPNKIYIHIPENYIDDFINTLVLIFEKRVKICHECNICKLYQNSSTSTVSKKLR